MKRNKNKPRRRTRRTVKKKSGKSGKKGKKTIQRTDNEDVSAQRTGLIWPWLASVTISNEVTCSAFIISSRIVVTVTRCFPTLATAGAGAAQALQALNDKKKDIVVIGQDEKVDSRYFNSIIMT